MFGHIRQYWTEWDGTEDITATNGQQIAVVEVDAEGTARELDDDAPRSLPRSRKVPSKPAVEIVTTGASDADGDAGAVDGEDDPFAGGGDAQ